MLDEFTIVDTTQPKSRIDYTECCTESTHKSSLFVREAYTERRDRWIIHLHTHTQSNTFESSITRHACSQCMYDFFEDRLN